MIVAIPSKGRPTSIPSAEVLPFATVFVPDAEVDAYRRSGVERVQAVPSDVLGITKTRNWILDHVQDERVVFVDDDVVSSGWFELFATRARVRALRPEEWAEVFASLFDVMDGMGYRVWGVGTDGALRSVYPHRPFVWRTYLTASCMGIRNDGATRFDESFAVKEDYELGLRCLVEDGGIVGARFVFWRNQHWTKAGGCHDYRTREMEADAIARLATKYPGMVRQVTRGGADVSIEVTV